MRFGLDIQEITPHTTLSFSFGKGKKSVVVGRRIITSDSERTALREQLLAILQNSQLEIAEAELREHEINGDKTTADFYEKRTELQNNIRSQIHVQQKATEEFYLQFVLFMQNATITDTDNSTGETKTITVADTRHAKPIESLWETPEECLAVLLSVYLEYAPFKDSLLNALATDTFDTGKVVELVTKN